MAYTQAQLNAVQKALAQGALRIEYEENGHKNAVTFQSRMELLALERQLKRELGAMPASDTGPVYPRYNKGL